MDLQFRRRLANVDDDLPWQALVRALEQRGLPRNVSQALDPYPKPARLPRGMRVDVVSPHRGEVGGGQTSCERVANFWRHIDGADVRIVSGPDGARDDAHATIWWGRAYQFEPRPPGLSVFFANAPSFATMGDLDACAGTFDRVIAASNGTRDVVRRTLGAGHTYIPITVAWNGAPELRAQPCGSDTVTLGYVGRYSQQDKNFLSLIAAMARLGDGYKLRLYGDGPDRPLIDRAARAWRVADRVKDVGPVEIDVVFPKMDALVVPSIFEATPSVVAEAMRAGVPVFATAVGDVPAILADGRGFLISDPGPEAIADAITCGTRAMCEVIQPAKSYADMRLSVAAMASDWAKALRETLA